MPAPTFLARTRLHFDWEDYPDPPEVIFRLAKMEAHFLSRVGFIQRAKFIAQRDMHMKFETETGPDGRWAPLKRPAFDQVGILRLTTDMFKAATDSSTYNMEPGGLYFDTGKLPPYWIFHEQPQGAIGDRIPRRSFIPLTEKARTQIAALFSQWVDEGIEIGSRGFVAQGRSPLGTFESLEGSQRLLGGSSI